MQCPLVTIVLLASWPQAGGVERPLATYVVRVQVGDNHGIRDITLEPVIPPAPGDGEEGDPPAPLKDRILSIAVVERDNFDRWLFADRLTDGARRARLEHLLKEKVETTAWEYRLTERQKAKLRLAASGD